MKSEQLLNSLWIAGIVPALVAQPVHAEVIRVTAVQINPTNSGLEITLKTSTGTELQVLTRSASDVFIADIPNTQLAIPEGQIFRSNNLPDSIAGVTVTQFSTNSIRVTVIGIAGVPKAEVVQGERGLVLSVTSEADTTATQPTPETPGSELVEELTKPTEAETPESEQVEEPTAEGEPLEITVTATRTEEETQDVPRSVTVITREEIDEQTNLTNNLQDILGQSVPGLAAPTQNSSTFGQTLRGRNVLVLIDGVPQSTSRNAFRDLRTIDPAAIERIDLFGGGTKKSQQSDIDRAKELYQEYKRRKKEASEEKGKEAESKKRKKR